jgi:hypothetical protein
MQSDPLKSVVLLAASKLLKTAEIAYIPVFINVFLCNFGYRQSAILAIDNLPNWL